MAPIDDAKCKGVCGLGDPVMDILATVSHEFLSTDITKEPGGCIPVDAPTMDKLQELTAKHSTLTSVPGGSAANVLKGISNISQGGLLCKFAGMVGNDETGKQYRTKLAAEGVEPMLLVSDSGAPSASCLCLVTPDGQRTMRTCLGASLELKAADQLPAMWHEGIQLLHCEGYCLYRPQLAKQMTQMAKERGAKVSMDLASFELVRNCKDALLEVLASGNLDMLFSNHEEANSLAAELSLASPDASLDDKVKAVQDFLLQYVKVSVVSLGSRGCVARSSSGEVGSSPAQKVKVVDTCSAGDMFTSGFLYAYLHEANLERCAAAGCAAGAEAVQVQGAEISADGWARLRSNIQGILQA